jgi:hypothetical protein
MWKKLKITCTVLGAIALMVAGGFFAFGAAATFLMNLGIKLHSNYEYYGQMFYGGYPSLVFIFGISAIGFLAPGFIIWWLHKRAWQVSLLTLFIVMTLVAVSIAIYTWSF